MTSVRTTHRSFLLFRFLTIPFLLLLVIALALDGLIAYADPPIGSVPAGVAKVRPSVVTILARGMPATPTQAQSGSWSIYNLGDFWHSLRPSEDKSTLQLTIQRKNAQSMISLQNPSLPKAVP